MTNIYIQNPIWDKTTIFRQTPYYSGLLGGHRFSSLPGLDYEWSLTDGIPNSIAARIPRSRRIAFIMENPYIWKPDLSFYDNVGIVVSPFDLGFPPHIKWVQHHPAVPWFYGLRFRTDTGLSHHQSDKTNKCLSYLSNRSVPPKNGKISIVTSSKGVTPGHRWRYNLVGELTRYFGNNIDVYGFGHRPVESKEDVIDSYSFSIAIENMASDYYMTEKLCDVALGMATPIYSGASRVVEYFSEPPRDIPFGCDAQDFCRRIARILDQGPDSDSVLLNRCNEVLYSNNLLSVILSIIKFS